MMITTKGRNALNVMIDLAQHREDGYVSVADLSARILESQKYLEAAMASLMSAGLVVSLRGKSGGYMLARGPEDINVAEILQCSETTIAPVSCLYAENPCERADICLSLPLWKELDDVIMTFLSNKTLAELLK
ncbi:MAG: Rrf2 family transcriptional regulator [Clostridia bacterium]|nr:Rrf2 family transcriptional regulator [Clostridia bacterium]